MEKYRHLKIEKDEFGHIINQCPYKKNHKNGSIIYLGGITCFQCSNYKGKDDDGNIVCKFGIIEDNLRNGKKN